MNNLQTTKTPDLSADTAPNTLSGMMQHPAYAARFNELLKNKAPGFISSVIQVGKSLGPDCDPKSIIASAMIAAALDLPINPNLGFAWIVPYRNKGQKMAQFQMGYKGFVQLALRTGQYSRLNVCMIYEGELQGFDKLTGDMTIDTSKRVSDKVIGYASYIRLVSGFEHAEYWPVEAVKSHAERYSQSFRGGFDSPWKTHFDQMAMKTVLSSHIRHWGPMSLEIQKASESDGAVIPEVDGAPDYVDNRVTTDEVPQLGEMPAQAPEPAAPAKPKPAPKAEVKPEPAPAIAIVEQPTIATPEPVQTEPDALVNIKEPAAIGDDTDQAKLLKMLEYAGVKPELFMNYIMVNGVDRKHNFDSEKYGHVSRWPAAACVSIASDAPLMTRIVQKFSTNKTSK